MTLLSKLGIWTIAPVGIAVSQDTHGKLQGVVSDLLGAIVAGANVTLQNDETNVQAQTKTSPTGQYIFDFVQPGKYTVKLELIGFKAFVQKKHFRAGARKR